MKYDINVDLANLNTSHAVVADLVGTGRRVLDVGCATGYLARILKDRGNVVSGVEIDAEAAKEAEPELQQVVIGDLESLDLVESFGRESFDVVVFADVLEHLRDPVGVLRSAVPLLAPGGSVVVSLPNVAHGSVRLALLEGRFEYRSLGLLDDTHLRFFTRRSVEELLGAAGLLSIDMRRTTADAFATEIPLSQDDFAADLVERVRGSADSDTYQFVFRAIPVQGGSSAELAQELVARNEELQSLRVQVAEILAAAGQFAPQHAVAMVVDSGRGGPWAALRDSVTTVEIRRRLEGVALNMLRADPVGRPATWRGDAVGSLEQWDDAAADLAADAYDAVVVTDVGFFYEHDAVADSLHERGCPVIPFAVDARVAERAGGSFPAGAVRGRSDLGHGGQGSLLRIPDPLVLADRLADKNGLPVRLEYLRATGRLRADGPYVLGALTATGPDCAGALGRALAKIATDAECSVVLLGGPPGAAAPSALGDSITGSCVVEDPAEIDLLALVHSARMVVTDSAAAAATAIALGSPVLGIGSSDELAHLAAWCADPDLVAPTPAELLSRVELADARAADGSLGGRLAAPLEMAYDDLASALMGAAARRLAPSMVELLRTQHARIAALDQANAALQARLVAERNALAVRAAQLRSGTSLQPDWEARRRADQAERAVEALQAELDAVMGTKTMRILSPGRKLYARLRSLPQ